MTIVPRLLHLVATTALAAALTTSSRAQVAASPAPHSIATHGVRWLVLIDDLHLDFRDTGRLRTAVAVALRTLFEARVLAAIHSDGPSPLTLTTTDATTWLDVSAAVKKITGNALKPSDIVRALATGSASSEPVYRARQAVTTLDLLVRDAGDRPTALLLISNGFRTDVPAVSAPITEMAALAGRAGVPIVAFDPQNFVGDGAPATSVSAAEAQHHVDAISASLQLLARDTGGSIWEQGDTLPSVLAWLRGLAP